MLEKTANCAFTCITKKTENKTDDNNEKGLRRKMDSDQNAKNKINYSKLTRSAMYMYGPSIAGGHPVNTPSQ